jgi:hypothetical protein
VQPLIGSVSHLFKNPNFCVIRSRRIFNAQWWDAAVLPSMQMG